MMALAAAIVFAALGDGGVNFLMSNAYAQPEQQRTCPEGFSLNRGQCEMEPEITTILVCPDNLPESPEGNCIVGVGSPINHLCPSTHPYQLVSNPEDPLKVCSTNIFGTGELVEKEYICAIDYELDTTIENVPRCFQVIPKVEEQVQEPCPEGSTLDTARNLCVTKPGRNNNNNNN